MIKKTGIVPGMVRLRHNNRAVDIDIHAVIISAMMIALCKIIIYLLKVKLYKLILNLNFL